MKVAVIAEDAGKTRDELMAVFPRHKVVMDAFVQRGDIVGIGPFTDGGSMAIFRSREAAEALDRKSTRLNSSHT